MLLRFKVENFLSFKEKEEFSLFAGKSRKLNHHVIKRNNFSIVKGGVIFGANASGKSNFIKAIDISSQIIKGGLNVPISNKYFKLCESNNYISEFEYEISIDEDVYTYGFSINLIENIIKEEWLYRITDKEEQCIFYIDNINGNSRLLKVENQERLSIYKEDLKENRLFLRDLSGKNLETLPELLIVQDIYKWFSLKLLIMYPDSKFSSFDFSGKQNKLIDLFNLMLKYFNTGIEEIDVKEIDFNKFAEGMPVELVKDIEKRIAEKQSISFMTQSSYYTMTLENGEINVKQLCLNHNVPGSKKIVHFDLEEESDGTRRLLDLIPLIQSINQSDRVIVIDEIDRSLHSTLIYDFIKTLLSIENSNSQLICTTHDTSLLDQKLLRRDEIWFMHKKSGVSSLASLEEFNVRFDKDIRKEYISGRYGAIPVLQESLLEKLSIKRIKVDDGTNS